MNPLKTVRLVKLHISYVSFVLSSFCSGTKATTTLKKEPSNSTRRKCRMLKLFIQRDGNRPVVAEEVRISCFFFAGTSSDQPPHFY